MDENTGRVAAAIAAHPREFVALLMAGLATTIIFVNALFMQRGPHPAPMFALRPQTVGVKSDRLSLPAPSHAAERSAIPIPLARVQKSVPGQQAHEDKIAELIAGSSQRVLAVQKALSDFGYGQINPTGVLGPETSVAIEKFENSHHMPITGKVSDRLLRELSTMSGRIFN